MFEEALIETRSSNSRWRTLIISGVVHSAILSLVIILPLIYYQEIPFQWATHPELLTFIEPEPPPGPPPPPQRSAQSPQISRIVRLPEFAAPMAMPRTIAPPLEEDVPASSDFWRQPGHAPFPGGGRPGWSGAPQGVIASGTSLPAPPPAPVERKEPLRVSNGAIMSRLMHRVDPEYPPLAIRARVEGIVVLQILVDEQGQVDEVEVVRGHPLLRESAVQAVSKWRYTPTLLNGTPVPVRATITVRFTLSR